MSLSTLDWLTGEAWFAASDLGWIVGHSYIAYAPLLAGNATVLFEARLHLDHLQEHSRNMMHLNWKLQCLVDSHLASSLSSSWNVYGCFKCFIMFRASQWTRQMQARSTEFSPITKSQACSLHPPLYALSEKRLVILLGVACMCYVLVCFCYKTVLFYPLTVLLFDIFQLTKDRR